MTDAPENQAERSEEGISWISIEKVAEGLGVKKPAVWYYIKKRSIQTKKFEFDRKTYIPFSDYQSIQAAKSAALPGLR
jgi:hypothetical protein